MLILICNDEKSSDKFIELGIMEYAKLFNTKLPDYKIVREADEKPCLSPDFLKFSLSHSNKYIVLALSEKEVGIDIQYHKEVDYDTIIKRFFNEGEDTPSPQEFYDLWASKEAMIKKEKLSLIEGMKTSVKNKNITLLNVIKNYSLAIYSGDKDYIFMFK